MFNTDSWQSHAEYRTNFKNLKAAFPSAFRTQLWDIYSRERQILLSLNLDPVGAFLSRFYSNTGRPALHQAQILRSMILFALLFDKTPARTSLTLWVNSVLPLNPVLISLVGCPSPDDLPPLGSYFDFMNRFWLGDRSIYGRNVFLPAGKNSKKPNKDIGADGKLAEQLDTSFSSSDIVKKIMNGEPVSNNPEALLQDIFYLAAVRPSLNSGLIPTDNFTLSGDGTAVVSHSSFYGHHHVSCTSSKSCPYSASCQRHYSDPDAGWGWDSSNKSWYFGRTLYMICCRNNALKIELPIIMKFTDARRHDSISFLYAIDEFGRHFHGPSPKNFCLDSAHDNIPTYELLEHWDINALIDINGRSTSYDGIPNDITLDKTGHPICRNGCRMCKWGNDPLKNAHKYRCPLKCGRIDSCAHESECSPGSYGRTLYIKNSGNLRFYPRIPRDSNEYKTIYSERTACERLNDRVLNDYRLQHMKIRGTDHFSFWTMIIGICIHYDARYKTGTL